MAGYARFKELSNGRRGGDDNEFHRQYSRTFLIETTDAFADSLLVLAHPSLPKIGDIYLIPETGIFDGYAEVISRDPVQPDSDVPTLWHVEVNYSTRGRDINLTSSGGTVGGLPGTGQGSGGYEDQPIQLPPTIEWLWVTGSKLFEKTAEATPKQVKTSGGEKFAQVPEVEDPRLVYRITRAEPAFDHLRAYTFMNTVNSNNFKSFGPRQARVIEYSGRRDYFKRIPFWWVTYQVAFRTPDWDFRIVDQGTQGIDATGVPFKFTDSAGNPIVRKLNGAGSFIADTAAEVYLTFKAFEEKDFAELNLP